jgi:nicotinamide mononucleotide (NMN) deamidase PncC/nicotinic acid mononucleotide adenylyltransferase
MASHPFASTVFLSVSGNPIGHNHFAVAEWLLRRRPDWERVVFILSQGQHPDPTKPAAEADAETRLAICRAAVAAVADPARGFLAQRAAAAGAELRITPERLALSTREFQAPGAVRTAQMVAWLREESPPGQGPIHWAVGTDLVRRMADPAIFSGADLALLTRACRFAILERPGEPGAADALALLQARRGVALPHDVYPLADVLPWLAPFLELSSTLIRHAAEAGDPLGGMLPRDAAEIVARQGLYRAGRVGARLVDSAGRELGTRSTLHLALDRAQAALDAEAGAVFAALDRRHAQGLPHGLAIVEGCVGGVLTAALAGRAGASRIFRQARFAYDRQAKLNLLGALPEGASSSSVEMVSALAQALRREAAADYCLAESGMAGPPDGIRRSFRNGQCALALAGPNATRGEEVRLNPWLTRREHMLEFSRLALWLLRGEVEG